MMPKKKIYKAEKESAKVAAKFLRNMSGLFSNIMCLGNWYEPTMPKSMKK